MEQLILRGWRRLVRDNLFCYSGALYLIANGETYYQGYLSYIEFKELIVAPYKKIGVSHDDIMYILFDVDEDPAQKKNGEVLL